MDAPPANPIPECPGCRIWQAECAALEVRVLVLETLVRDLEDRLRPPPPKRPLEPQPPAPAQVPTGKKRGAQPGHPPHLKSFLPSERVKAVVDHVPECCAACDKSLSAVANDPAPKRHQVAELPPILAEITEHRGHTHTCSCGHTTCAAIPAAVRKYSLGPHLTATAVYLIGSFGLSKRNAEELIESLFGVPEASELLVAADGGGSNASRSRLWKVELQKLADDTRLFRTVENPGHVGDPAMTQSLSLDRYVATAILLGQRPVKGPHVLGRSGVEFTPTPRHWANTFFAPSGRRT